ncbi:MAG: hypothetical protein ACOCV8_03615, partial [Spirochaetota bacterium]
MSFFNIKNNLNKKQLLYSIICGLVIGIIFFLLAEFFIEYKDPTKELIFKISCVAASIFIVILTSLITKIAIFRIIKYISKEIAKLVSEGDEIIQRIDFESKDALGELVNNMNTFIDRLAGVVINIKEFSNKGTHISEELTDRSEKASTSIENISFIVENIKDESSKLNEDITN